MFSGGIEIGQWHEMGEKIQTDAQTILRRKMFHIPFLACSLSAESAQHCKG